MNALLRQISIVTALFAGLDMLSSAASEDVHHASKKSKPEDVAVEIVDSPMPEKETERDAFLWDHFSSRPEEIKFESYSSKKWKSDFAIFVNVLVRKANEKSLDSVSLRKVLDLVLKHSEDRLAYLPVGAYQTTLSGNPVWIIAVRWEYSGTGARLGHIRMFAFDQKTLAQVGFTTCM